MANMSGADPEALEHAGERISRAGDELRRKRTVLSRSLDSVPWEGRNADRFRHDFHTVHARSLIAAADFLHDAQSVLRRNAEEQRTASGATGQSAGRRWFPGFPGIPIPPGFGWRPFPLPELNISIPTFDFWKKLPDIGTLSPLPVPILPLIPLIPIVIGRIIGSGGIGMPGWRPETPIHSGVINHIVDGSESTNSSDGTSGPAPEATQKPEPQPSGPSERAQRMVDIAKTYKDQARTGKNGECIMWVKSWVDEAGLPPIKGGMGGPFEAFGASPGWSEVDTSMGDIRPGDILQRGLNGTWDGVPHTAVVQSYDSATGMVTITDANWSGDGKVRTDVTMSIERFRTSGGKHPDLILKVYRAA